MAESSGVNERRDVSESGCRRFNSGREPSFFRPASRRHRLGAGPSFSGAGMKPYILYHANCYDGFGSAFAAWQAYGDGGKYIAVKYGDEPPALPLDADVLICDFSYPRETLLRLKKAVNSLVVIDHHKTAHADLEGLDFCQFDMTKSGAVLTWEFLHPTTPIPALLEYIQDRDLWKFALHDSKEVSAALRAYPMDFQIWSGLNFHELKNEGKAILKFTQQMVSIMADNAWLQDIGGHIVPVTNATVFFSEVGEELCKRNPHLPFSAYFLDRSDGKRQWGLRSRGDFDVSEVAKRLGGGGHKSAAGFIQERPS